MKFRGLMLGLIALAILGGLVYWSEKKQKWTLSLQLSESPPKLG